MITSVDVEDPAQSSAAKRGGWITIPFILGTMGGLSIGFGTLLSTLEIYLIEQFNIKRITAAQIFNLVNGFLRIIPIGAAILADSFLSCYSVVWISSAISSLGMLLLTLTSVFSKLRPPPCQIGSNNCTEPTKVQLTVLYLSLSLAILGMGGTRLSLSPIGAHQLDKGKDRETFYNWFTFVFHSCLIVSSTAIVYVVGNVSWAWGLGISSGANTLGLLLFILGTHFYRQMKPGGSPFAALASVVVNAIRNRGILLSQNATDYWQELEDKTPILPSNFLRFLNRAALRTEIDAELTRKPWKHCTVAEVEDFKSLIKMLPLWTSGIFLCIPYIAQVSLGILQALTMERNLGHNFKFPAAMIVAFIFISTCITIVFIDLLLIPMWNKFGLKPLTPLQRIGIGHSLYILSMVALVLVEAKRLKIFRSHNLQTNQDNAIVPMSIFWLLPPLALAGIAEAFNFPGQISFYYTEFPKDLKNTSAAVVSLNHGIAFYLANALIHFVRRSTDWLPDDINKGRLDNVYWLITILVGLNFCYFLVCASFYKYKPAENVVVLLDDVIANEE